MSDLTDGPLCSACGFPLDEYNAGLRYFGTHTAHVEWYCTKRMRGEIDAQAKEIEALRAERDAFKQTMYDELDENLRLRELGGAREDEPMTTFLERVFVERDALRSSMIDIHAACTVQEGATAHEHLRHIRRVSQAAIDAAMAAQEKPCSN